MIEDRRSTHLTVKPDYIDKSCRFSNTGHSPRVDRDRFSIGAFQIGIWDRGSVTLMVCRLISGFLSIDRIFVHLHSIQFVDSGGAKKLVHAYGFLSSLFSFTNTRTDEEIGTNDLDDS